jgi:hypothetical protein
MQSRSGTGECFMSGFNETTDCYGLGCWKIPEWVFFSRNLWELLLFVFLLWMVYALLLWAKYLLQEREADWTRAKYAWLVGKSDHKKQGNWIVRARAAWITSSNVRVGSLWIISWLAMVRWCLRFSMLDCNLLESFMGAILYVFSLGLVIWVAWKKLNE